MNPNSETIMALVWITIFVTGCVLFFLNAGLETGFYVLNKIRLEVRAHGGYGPAKRLYRLIQHRTNLLAVLLIGTNLGNYLATLALTALFVRAGYAHRAEWYTLGILVPGLFVFCESVPKNLFQRTAETLVYRLGWFVSLSSRVFNVLGLAPLVQGVALMLIKLTKMPEQDTAGTLAREGLWAMLAEGQASGAVTHAQTVMADRIMHISEVSLSDVMIPMKRTHKASLDASDQEIISQLKMHNYSRIPLVDKSNQIAGIVDITDILESLPQPSPIRKIIAPLILNDQSSVTDALYRMQRSRRNMAVVADQTGRHVGIVTIKDLVEEIVGELEAW